MDRMQRIITTTLWAVLVLAMVGVVVGQLWLPRRHPGHELGVEQRPRLQELFPAASFTLTDQNGKTVRAEQLRGHPWVADFIFTTCGNVCPLMSRKMLEVQKKTPAAVEFVSFTVNPEHDTPPVLKEYARNLGADDSRWFFLTGTPEQMTAAARGMNLFRNVEPDGNVGHSNKFLLVNGGGKVVGIYNGTDEEDVKRLISDAAELARGGNAS